MGQDFRKTAPVIADSFAALDMLMRRCESRIDTRIIARVGEDPYLEVMHCGGGYTRDCYEGGDYYAITPEVVRDLRLRGYVTGRKHWGYTDDTEFRLTEEGMRWWRVLRDEREKEKAAVGVDKSKASKK